MYHSGIISGQKSGAGLNQGTPRHRARTSRVTHSLTLTIVRLEFPHQVSLEEIVFLYIAELKVLIYVRRSHLVVDRHRVSIPQRRAQTIGPIVGDRNNGTLHVRGRIEDIRVDQVGIDRVVSGALPIELAVPVALFLELACLDANLVGCLIKKSFTGVQDTLEGGRINQGSICGSAAGGRDPDVTSSSADSIDRRARLVSALIRLKVIGEIAEDAHRKLPTRLGFRHILRISRGCHMHAGANFEVKFHRSFQYGKVIGADAAPTNGPLKKLGLLFGAAKASGVVL